MWNLEYDTITCCIDGNQVHSAKIKCYQAPIIMTTAFIKFYSPNHLLMHSLKLNPIKLLHHTIISICDWIDSGNQPNCYLVQARPFPFVAQLMQLYSCTCKVPLPGFANQSAFLSKFCHQIGLKLISVPELGLLGLLEYIASWANS